ncbi:hypothetical protein MKY98_05570 [Paenibacillus sp. FSL M8-0228]|jgi:hypothetical protein|uniref:hypothetical protein n=1 Tax=Paenibacillus TaxID=44249 RepID=UPI000414A2D6|nr:MULTISPECIES: hypothetical protein [Paenibacillus]KEO80015.1 hypothetical protein EL23_00275 [Paenibacillus polymyxa]MBO3283465.1 hypothetical protein [Paenibacillus polymyxa]MBP1311791.1 hypothetical protein [Paenibacillus sp. 1182]MCH6186114.1 hypothetical protein [Paenibacillus polymyxa]ODB58608.1 hypothetical protein A7311_12840 [Paenibacillus polymyxa]
MIKRILELIANALLDEDNYLLEDALRLLKTNANLEELVDDYYTQLVRIIPMVKEDSAKVLLIETIVNSPDFNGDDELLDEYIKLIAQGATYVKDAVSCLNSFNNHGCNEIFVKLAENVDKELAFEILVLMDESKWGPVPKSLQPFSQQLESFAKEVRLQQKIGYRSWIIGAFLLIVHPLCSKYASISALTFGYPYTEAAVNDWAWVTPKSTESIIESKIVTPKEAEILRELGGLLWNKTNLTPELATKLYSEFFEDRNPFDVIFTLPE